MFILSSKDQVPLFILKTSQAPNKNKPAAWCTNNFLHSSKITAQRHLCFCCMYHLSSLLHRIVNTVNSPSFSCCSSVSFLSPLLFLRPDFEHGWVLKEPEPWSLSSSRGKKAATGTGSISHVLTHRYFSSQSSQKFFFFHGFVRGGGNK